MTTQAQAEIARLRNYLEVIEQYAQRRTTSHLEAAQLLRDIRALAGKALVQLPLFAELETP